MQNTALRAAKLDLRLSPQAKHVLGLAARATHRSVSQFVLESALARAEEALLERRRFALDAAQWTDFMAALDAPPVEMPRLARLLTEPGVFDPA